MVNSDYNYRNITCPNWSVKAEEKNTVTKPIQIPQRISNSSQGKKKIILEVTVKNRSLAMWFFSLATWGVMNMDSRLGHTYCSVHYSSHKLLYGQNKGWCLEHVNWDKKGTCLRGDTVSCRKSPSVLRAGTLSVEQFQRHQGTSCSDEYGLAQADLELSQIPCPHLVGKKNRHMQTPWFPLEMIQGSVQKRPLSTRARSKLLRSLFWRTLMYSN